MNTAQPPVLDRFFGVSERGSTVAREVRGGVVTFFTMAYIVVLNPLILGFIADLDGGYLGGGTEPNLPAIAAATALVAGTLSILMGLVANFPLALATGLGLNAFIAAVVASQQMTWADAMGMIVIEGAIILVLVLTGFRTAVLRAIPQQLKVAISVGIGLFLVLVGLVGGGVVTRVPDAAGTTVPVQLGDDGTLSGWPILVFVVGLSLMVGLWAQRVRGAILVSIVVMTAVAIAIEAVAGLGSAAEEAGGWALTVPALPDDMWRTPDFGTVGQFSLLGSWHNAGVIAALLLVFSLLLADFFDTMGTMTAIGAEANLLDEEGMPPRTRRILVVDSLAAVAGGAAGVSSNTSYIESASGVGEGARTGLASVVTGVLFLLTIFLAPFVAMIPSEAAVPALVLVGFLMMQQVAGIDWDDVEIAVPAFLTIVLMPFAYSITVGIGAGFLAYAFLKLVRGRPGQVHPLLWLVAGLFVVYFAIDPITAWLT